MEKGAGGSMPVPKYQEEFYMKKLISILVAFAMLAGAVFAQDEGSWSVGGSGRIGVSLDFLQSELTGESTDVAHWGAWADGWDQGNDNVKGGFDVNYNRGGLSAGLGFSQTGKISAKVSNYGDNWAFEANSSLNDLLTGGIWFDTLWGNFTFQALEGIKVEAAVSRKGQQWWSTTEIFGDTFTHTQWQGGGTGKFAGFGKGIDGGWTNYGGPDGSYLLVDVAPMAGLNLGFVIPNVFVYNTSGDSAIVDFVTDALQWMVFGVKYADGPIGAAVQFALKGQATKYNDKGEVVSKRDSDLDAAVYLGVQYQISDQMKAGLEVRAGFGGQKGYMDDDNKYQISDAIDLGIGASFNFDAGPFGAGITLKFRDEDRSTSLQTKEYFDHNQSFAIAPMVYYNVVENYLQFKLEAEITLVDAIEKLDDKGKPVYASVMNYNFKPQLFFNFLGTGAGDWGTGFAVRYVVSGPKGYFEPTKGHNTDNFMEIVFNWSF